MSILNMEEIFTLLSSENYAARAIGEYLLVKDKYEKLHRIIVKREAGKLDFSPKCTMEQWKAQAAAMGSYLYQLEVKAEMEGYGLDEGYVRAHLAGANCAKRAAEEMREAVMHG